jgi:DNA-binding XRE family transcriptional regulator
MRQNLRQARKNTDKTQKETAITIGISERMYQDIEAGTREGKGRIWDALEALFDTPQRQLRENDTQQDSSTNDINLISKCYRGVSMKRQAMSRLTERAHE